jgi:hypothetical protein
MKKVLLSAACLVLFGIVHVHAQSKVRFLVKGGLIVSNVTYLEGEWNPGMNVGAGMDWQISKKIGLETGLYYSEYGSKRILRTIDNMVSQEPIKYYSDFSAYHLQIPVLVKYYVYKGFNIFAGPQAGYKLKHNYSGGYHLYGNDFYFSGVAGAGYLFDFGLYLSANYTLDLTELDPSSETIAIGVNENGETEIIPIKYESKNIRISAFQFNIGWRF